MAQRQNRLFEPLLPIQEFPEVTPPTVTVSDSYAGANAYDVEESVTQPFEDKLNGVQGMIYLESSSTSTGQAGLLVRCGPGGTGGRKIRLERAAQ